MSPLDEGGSDTDQPAGTDNCPSKLIAVRRHVRTKTESDNRNDEGKYLSDSDFLYVGTDQDTVVFYFGVQGTPFLVPSVVAFRFGHSYNPVCQAGYILRSYDFFVEETQIVHCKIRYPKRHVGLHPITGAVG